MRRLVQYLTLLRKLDVIDDGGMILALGRMKPRQRITDFWNTTIQGLRTTAVDFISGEPIGDRYILQRPLGAGGMGEVYAAIDLNEFVKTENIGRTVAVKRLQARSLLSSDMVGRFRREIAASLLLSRLNNPHVIKMLDNEFGLSGEPPFAVFEHRPALQSIDQHSLPISIEPAIGITLRVASALFSLHELGLLHRDIKPQNVLWDGANEVRLIDFGMVKIPPELFQLEPQLVLAFSITPLTAAVGTPIFMPPEQFLGQSSESTDVFGLCSLLVFMLTKSPRARADHALLWSPSLRTLIRDGMEHSKQRRIQTVAEFAARLAATDEGSQLATEIIEMPDILRNAIELARLNWS